MRSVYHAAGEFSVLAVAPSVLAVALWVLAAVLSVAACALPGGGVTPAATSSPVDVSSMAAMPTTWAVPARPSRPSISSRPAVPARAFRASVVRVVDGDTFVAFREGGARLRVRLIGIDAPESVRLGSPVQCFGPESATVLRGLLPRGSPITAAYQGHPHQDRFGRELWDVWQGDGGFLAGRLVQTGAARARAFRPQHRFAAWLERLEASARRARRGLHGACGLWRQ